MLGLVAVVFVALFTPYCDLVMQGTWVGLTSFPISAFFVLCLLVGINALLSRWRKSRRPDEVLFVYVMALVAAGIPSFGWTGLLIPYLAGPFYFATPENNWAQILHPHLPKFLFPQQKKLSFGYTKVCRKACQSRGKIGCCLWLCGHCLAFALTQCSFV